MSTLTTIAAIQRDDETLSQIGAGIRLEGELSAALWAWRQWHLTSWGTALLAWKESTE